jgi:hypothetical protein
LLAASVRADRRAGFLSAAFFASVAAALGVFGWQGLTWLTTSTWKPVSVLTALNWLHVRWALSPGAWPELHHMLGHTPLALALLGVAGVCFLLYALLN